MIWTDNPKYMKKKENFEDPRYSFHTIYQYNATRDPGMVIDIADICRKSPLGTDGLTLFGDIFVRIKNARNQELICRIAFNTAFIERGSAKYTLDKFNVDPDKIQKDPKYPGDFKIQMLLENECQMCRPSNALNFMCKKCKSTMGTELNEWKAINTFVSMHEKRMGVFENMNHIQ